MNWHDLENSNKKMCDLCNHFSNNLKFIKPAGLFAEFRSICRECFDMLNAFPAVYDLSNPRVVSSILDNPELRHKLFIRADINPFKEPVKLDQATTSPETKKCPHCAEEIKYEAVFCKHCRQNILPPSVAGATIEKNQVGNSSIFLPPERKPFPIYSTIGIVLVVLGLFVFLKFFEMDTSVAVSDPDRLFDLNPRRVHNIGLMQERQLGVIIGIVMTIIGGFLCVLGRKHK